MLSTKVRLSASSTIPERPTTPPRFLQVTPSKAVIFSHHPLTYSCSNLENVSSILRHPHLPSHKTGHSSSFKYSRSTAVSVGQGSLARPERGLSKAGCWLLLLRLTDKMPLSLASPYRPTLSHVWPAQFGVQMLMALGVHGLGGTLLIAAGDGRIIWTTQRTARPGAYSEL